MIKIKHLISLVSFSFLIITFVGYIKPQAFIAYAQTSAALIFNESSINIKPKEKYSIPIQLNIKDQKVAAVDIVLKYNPNVINISNGVSSGAFDNTAIQKIDNDQGIATFHLLNNQGNYVTKSQDILYISVYGSTTGTTDIEISKIENDTFIEQLAEDQNNDDQNTNDKVEPSSHIILNTGEDILNKVSSVRVNVRVENNADSSEIVGIQEAEDGLGIMPIQEETNNRVLGASDDKSKTLTDYASDLAKILIDKPIYMAAGIGGAILLVVVFKIYFAYKKSLDDTIDG